MEKKIETSLPSSEKAAKIYTPLNIAEQTGVSGFAFAKRLAAQTGLQRKDISQAFFEGTKSFKHAELANKLAAASAGGPTIGENSITIWISANSPSTGSEADYIWLYFGLDKRVRLSPVDGKFPSGSTLAWDFSAVSDWLEDNIETDLWDEIALTTNSNDGIYLDRIRIIHSGETILTGRAGCGWTPPAGSIWQVGPDR